MSLKVRALDQLVVQASDLEASDLEVWYEREADEMKDSGSRNRATR